MPAFTKDTVQKLKKGQATLADLFGIDAKQVAALLITGHTLWQQGQLQKAKNIFAGLSLLDPANPYLHAMLGSIHQKQGSYDAAVQQYNWALQNFPADVQSLTNRAESMKRANQSSSGFSSLTLSAPFNSSTAPSTMASKFLCSLSACVVRRTKARC